MKEPDERSLWLAICVAASLGGGAFMLLAMTATAIVMLEPRFDRITQPLEYVTQVAAVAIGSGAIGCVVALCLAVTLTPLGALFAWSMRIKQPAVYGGMLYSGMVAMLTIAPLFAVLVTPTAAESLWHAALCLVAMVVGQLVGFYARSLSTRLGWAAELKTRGPTPRITLRQGMAGVAWLSLAFTLLKPWVAPLIFLFYAYLLVLLWPCVAWALAVGVARMPRLPEQAMEAYRSLKTPRATRIDPHA